MESPERQSFEVQKTDINYLKGVGPKITKLLKKNLRTYEFFIQINSKFLKKYKTLLAPKSKLILEN